MGFSQSSPGKYLKLKVYTCHKKNIKLGTKIVGAYVDIVLLVHQLAENHGAAH